MPDHRANDNRRSAAGGLRRIATPQTLADGATPCDRHHMANRFARLENDRARLERELVVWERCRRAVATRLAKVNAEIAALRPALLDGAGAHGGLRRRPATPHAGERVRARFRGPARPSSNAGILRGGPRCAAGRAANSTPGAK